MTETPRRGRGRPKGTGIVDPDDIIATALDSLAEGGYRSLAMRDVARTLNVSLSSIQNHFRTKDDLWRAAVDHLRNDTIERRNQSESFDLRTSIMRVLEGQSSRPGLLASLLTDSGEGSTERIAYVAETFRSALAQPTEVLRQLEEVGIARRFNHDALFALMTIGIGSMATSRQAIQAIYGFDISTEVGRSKLASELSDILALGLRAR